jgi:glycosyltransferase involved in cell wall biosynthesis
MKEIRSRLSIGMPVYNGEQYLEEALNSIQVQTYEDFELIISDNASTDRTREICKEISATDQRIRYFQNHRNLGAAKNYNRVFELSTGEYFKWAAHDDVLAPVFLEKCVENMDYDPSLVLCYSKTAIIDGNGDQKGLYNSRLRADQHKPEERFMDLVLVRHPCTAVFGVIRRDFLQKTPLIGPYVGSDRNLLAELGLFGRLYEIQEYLFSRRDHPQASISKYDRQDRLKWFDPQKMNRIQLLHLRTGIEYFKSVARVPLPWSARRECYRIIAFWLFKREREALFEDLNIARRNLLGRKTHSLDE